MQRCLQILLRLQLVRLSLLHRWLEGFLRLTVSQNLVQLLRPALDEPLGPISDQSVEAFIELHALVVKVLDRLYEKLLDLTDLVLLRGLIELLELLLQAKSEAKQIAIVGLELADDVMAL